MLTTAFSLDIFAKTDVGLVREQNEDFLQYNEKKGVFVVADGMGGHNAGEVASQLATHAMFDFLMAQEKYTLDILKKGIEEANSLIYKKSKEESAYFGMGTTILVLALENDTAFFAHVGDSRLYLFREGHLSQLTSDHTLVNELISLGTLKKQEDSEQLPFKHILTKALGTHQKIEPSLSQFSLKEGDLFLLCTDGLSNNISERELIECFNKNISINEKGENLMELAKNHGGGDNITLILGAIRK